MQVMIVMAAVAAGQEGIPVRTWVLLLSSAFVAVVGGLLGFASMSAGTHGQRIAGSVIIGAAAFCVSYTFFENLVPPS